LTCAHLHVRISHKVKQRRAKTMKNELEKLSERYGWPLTIERDGYTAKLQGIQPTNDGNPLPIYRFPGGSKVVFF
jgi:predicted Rossmann fold nucleotide-binding protein DprA/Smf involved in DNA uptake